MSLWVLAGWVAFFLVAWPYVQRRRHPKTQALAAYLIFITVVVAVAGLLFFLISRLLLIAGGPGLLARPLPALGAFLLAFLPAWFAGRALIRRPPKRPPRLD